MFELVLEGSEESQFGKTTDKYINLGVVIMNNCLSSVVLVHAVCSVWGVSRAWGRLSQWQVDRVGAIDLNQA